MPFKIEFSKPWASLADFEADTGAVFLGKKKSVELPPRIRSSIVLGFFKLNLENTTWLEQTDLCYMQYLTTECKIGESFVICIDDYIDYDQAVLCM